MVDTAQSKKAVWPGLGLAIVKHIITQHRGDFEILSYVGKGTEIRIYLPSKYKLKKNFILQPFFDQTLTFLLLILV